MGNTYTWQCVLIEDHICISHKISYMYINNLGLQMVQFERHRQPAPNFKVKRHWTPSQKLDTFQKEIGSGGCKRSNLNAIGTEPQVSRSKSSKSSKISLPNWLKRLQMVQFECYRPHLNTFAPQYLRTSRPSNFSSFWSLSSKVLKQIGSRDCKWLSLNAIGTQPQVS